MKVRNRIRSTLKLFLLITISILCLTGLTINIILNNYIKKINIIDNASPAEALVIDYPTLSAEKDAASYAASDISNRSDGTDSISEQKQTNEVYEVYQGFKDQLNMQELVDEEQGIAASGAGQSVKVNNPGHDDTLKKATNPGQDDIDKKVADPGQDNKAAKVIDEEETGVEPIIDDKVMNLLLIGQDAKCSDNTSPECFAIFTVNKRAKKLVTTTLANNLYLNIPELGKDRLVMAYRIGGASLMIKTLEKNFGVVIDGYVMADYSAYIDIVDTIGGVEITIAKEELDPVNRNIREINEQLGYSKEADIIAKKGRNLLNGKQALGYSRNWYDQNGDLISYGNQKAIILSILSKVKDFNIIEMNGFLNEVLPKITTNLSEGRILEFIVMLPVYFNYGIDYLSLPIKGTEKKLRVNNRMVLDYNAKQNLSQLYSHLYAMQ